MLRPVTPANAYTPTLVTERGRSTSVNLVFLKQYAPTDLRPSERLTFSREVQPSNADLPRVVTVEGIFTVLRPVNP